MRSLNKFLLAFLPAFLLVFNVLAATPHIDTARTRQKAKEALQFCKKHGFNTRYCFLVDMSLPSGVKRFVVWDFAKNQMLTTGLVSHGCGKMPWSGMWSKDKPVFSNTDGSHCTPLGKYRIDGRAYSAWGIHVKYYLAGLESTNSNALKRQVVFHSWEAVSEDEVYPNGTPEGWGCPAISNNTMKIADALIRRQKGHMLMWIYS